MLFVIGLLAFCGLGCLWRSRGLDPPSLWLDDQWTAIAIRKMAWQEFFQLNPPIPIGFVAILKLLAGVSKDNEWPLQMFPAACSIVQLPLLALLVARTTGRRSLGLLAAALLLVNPTVGTYAVRVKPFASDSLTTILLLLAGLPLMKRWTCRRAIGVAAMGVVALLFSFTSVFISLPLVNLGLARWLRLHGKTKTARGQAISIAMIFNAALILFYYLLLQGQSNDEMKAFWSDAFLPLQSAASALAFVYSNVLGTLVGGAFPGPGWHWAGALLVLPCVILIREPATRSRGILLLTFYCLLVSGSALHLYPVGTGRTDIFSYPVTLLVLCFGLHVIIHRLRLGKYAGLTVVLLALAMVARYGSASIYRPCEDAQLVASLQRLAGDDDAVVIYPHGSFAVGYYSNWPMQVRPWDQYAHGFEIQFQRPFTLTLPGYTDLEKNLERLGADLDRFLAPRHERIFYLAAYVHLPTHQFVHEWIKRAGYEAVDNIKSPAAQLIQYNAR